MSMSSLAIIVISDEILRGDDSDNVSKFLIKELARLQYNIVRVTVVPELEAVITHELKILRNSTDIVLVVGGVQRGTVYAALGKLVGEDLECNNDLISLLSKLKEAYDKNEVYLPKQAKILSNNVYPVIYLQRIFVQKMKHVQKTFPKLLKDHLAKYKTPKLCSRTIQISQNAESRAIDISEFTTIHKNVQVDVTRDDNFITFKFSSNVLADAALYQQRIKNAYANSASMSFVEDTNIFDEIYQSQDIRVKYSLEQIEKCFKDYGPDRVFLSFNGGKDCTVLLHLTMAVINKKFAFHTKPIFCMYVQSENAFPEQDTFINNCQSFFNLEMYTVKSGIKNGLQQTLTKFSRFKACLMGTRRSDPFAINLKVFQMTDSDWPQVMRCSPLLDWHYSDIWDYLLFFKVPYCELYDKGYTSLGNTKNTTKNPSLLYKDPLTNKETYLPAYKLLKENKEREGRSTS